MDASTTSPALLRAAQLCVKEYLCVDKSDHVLITTDNAGDQGLISALSAALYLEGIRGAVLTIPQLPLQGSLADPFMPSTVYGAASHCDVWIDLTYPYIAGSDAQAKVMETRAIKYLLGSDLKGESMARIFGDCDIHSVTSVMEQLYGFFAEAAGKDVRIKTPLGTDVSFVLAPPDLPEPAQVNEPGLYFIPGANVLIPEIESTIGQIVVESVFHEFYTPLKETVTLHVDGKIRRFEGGGHEAVLLDAALRRAGGGDDYGYIIHFSNGFHPTARVTGRCFVEDMRAIGSNAVGMGLPFWQPGGGENHPDAVMTRQSMWIEGKEIVREGVFVGDPDLAEKCANLKRVYL